MSVTSSGRGCVTPQILQQLARCRLTEIQGWNKLKYADLGLECWGLYLTEPSSSDKERVIRAIKACKVADNDFPPSARQIDWSQLDPVPKPLQASRASTS